MSTTGKRREGGPAPAPLATVLVIDDQQPHAEATAEWLERAGFRTVVAASGQAGLAALDSSPVDVVVTDLVMHDVDGLEILRHARKVRPGVEVIVISGHGTVDRAVEAMRQGAYNFLEKGEHLVNHLRETVRNAVEKQSLARTVESLQRQLDERFGFEGIVASSPPMRRVMEVVSQIAGTTATVLITGESGTGKELIAKTIHSNSPRKGRPFVPLNCAALSEGILESELFGHEKGAFTGATQSRQGRFEYADGGTLFLDEVGDMPASTQIKLLRVLEEREIMRVGSNIPVKVDVRLIAATNRDLHQAVQEKLFREDLYFRLNVVPIALPPLRERPGDIALLIDRFTREFGAMHGKNVTGMTPEVRKILARYRWPGNVRELKNAIENMVVTARSDVLDEEQIPATLLAERVEPTGLGGLAGMSIQEVERELIRQTLALVTGNREEAARMLGIGERTLYRKLKKYRLQ